MPNSQPVRQPLPNLDVIRRDSNHVVFSYANVLLLLWRGPQVPAICDSIYSIAVDLAHDCGTGKVGAVSVLQRGTTAPSPSAREALVRLHDDREGVIHRSALVFPNDGFIAAIVRSIVLGVRQRASRRGNHDVFQRVDKALAWVTDGLPTPNGLPIAVAALMRALENYDVLGEHKVA